MARGSIRQRGTSWEVRVYVGKDVTGKKRWLTRSVPGVVKDGQLRNKREAERVLTAMLGEVTQHNATAHDATVSTLLERWQESAAADWSPATVAAYETYIRRHILPTLGRVKVRNLRPSDLDALYGRLRAEPVNLSAASVGKVHTILRRALAEAVRWGWITSSPADRARPPKVTRPDLHPPEPAQVRALLDQLERDEKTMFLTFVYVAASTGARRGEVCALKWSDVDLAAGSMLIARSIVQGKASMAAGRSVSEKGTKTHQARRISLDARTVSILKEHRKRAVELALRCGSSLSENAYLFSSAADGSVPWRPDGVTARFAKARKKVGLDHVRLHDLRHYVATRLLTAGTDVRTVAGRLGHANAATTLNVYSHFVPAADKAAAEQLAAELG